MSDQPVISVAPVLFGVRCTDPDPIGHDLGRVFAEGRDRASMAHLAAETRCYELVQSLDEGATWSRAEP